jgi:hypothetical protein
VSRCSTAVDLGAGRHEIGAEISLSVGLVC